MEELSEHMSLHLKDHLGDRDAMEELGWWVRGPSDDNYISVSVLSQ